MISKLPDGVLQGYSTAWANTPIPETTDAYLAVIKDLLCVVFYEVAVYEGHWIGAKSLRASRISDMKAQTARMRAAAQTPRSTFIPDFLRSKFEEFHGQAFLEQVASIPATQKPDLVMDHLHMLAEDLRQILFYEARVIEAHHEGSKRPGLSRYKIAMEHTGRLARILGDPGRPKQHYLEESSSGQKRDMTYFTAQSIRSGRVPDWEQWPRPSVAAYERARLTQDAEQDQSR